MGNESTPKETIDQKIHRRMDELQEMMDGNIHLTNSTLVKSHMATISKFWSRLNDEDQDYYNCAQFAMDEGLDWGTGEK
jgi:hypothetical protein